MGSHIYCVIVIKFGGGHEILESWMGHGPCPSTPMARSFQNFKHGTLILPSRLVLQHKRLEQSQCFTTGLLAVASLYDLIAVKTGCKTQTKQTKTIKDKELIIIHILPGKLFLCK